MTNPTNDRDATVDRLLAGTLARGPADAGRACLDADTLAAWADHALDAGELAAAEAHAADCARCQAMFAAMVRSTPPPETVESVWRLSAVRWLIPLTAAAAAVILWMTVPLRDMRPPAVREVSQIAEAPPPTAAASAAADAVAPSEGPVATSRLNRRQETPGQEKDKEVEANKKAAAPNANAIVDAPARSADALLEKAQPVAEPRERAAPPPASPARALALRAPEAVIVSSNPASRWRIVTGGAVQRSADGGATWETQNTGVSDTLSAGSSPSPSVCWLVGPGGIVLLSADGGRSWKRVVFPEAVSLVAVRATDDQTVTVTTADGRSFVTEDGGRTWARAPGV